ncbi:MAG: hypothetical protein ACXV3U_08795 [Halobacteriota archaeon]
MKAPSDASTRCRHNHLDHEPSARAKVSLGTLELTFDVEELRYYVERRKCGFSEHSIDWIDRASLDLWHSTHGTISKERMQAFRSFVLTNYQSAWSHGKTLAFAKAFPSYLTKLHLDGRYKGFHLFLDPPKAVKVRKRVTTRIITLGTLNAYLSIYKMPSKTADLTELGQRIPSVRAVWGICRTAQRVYDSEVKRGPMSRSARGRSSVFACPSLSRQD